nr:Ig-like domain-containing protein [Lachnospiraceae bacterium]
TKKTYAAYKKYTDTSVSYRSSDTSVATVDKKGKISVKKGTAGKTATIYVVSADGKQKAEILITVK